MTKNLQRFAQPGSKWLTTFLCSHVSHVSSDRASPPHLGTMTDPFGTMASWEREPCFWFTAETMEGLPSRVWYPSTLSWACGGTRTGPPLLCPALAEDPWRASWLSGAGVVPVLAFARTAAQRAPCHRRTCPPKEMITEKETSRS